MRLSWRHSSGSAKRFEDWITQSHQKQVLTGGTIPVGSCPDEAFLDNLARRSKRISLADPRVHHAANCPTCMIQLLESRREISSHQHNLVLAGSIACLVVALAFIGIVQHIVREQPPAVSTVAVSQTVDLWDAGTIRGEPSGSRQTVSLPAALLKVTIVLPRSSPLGDYAVAITRDQKGNGVLAESNATATANGQREIIFVNLDLRKTPAGRYFLSTTHEQDQVSYYYPLQIQ
jgi:hypothetical protein